jgi:hypothetical protein
MVRHLDDWFDGKKAETAASTVTFYRSSLEKLLQFLGKRSDDPMIEVTKQSCSVPKFVDHSSLCEDGES